MKAHSIQKNHSNETGRSMVEILGVLSIMGVLSLAAVSGIAYTIRKQVVVETVGLINKSTAGILTSGILEKGANANVGNGGGNYFVSSEQIQLNSYMSNVPLTTADDREKYGSETFVGPRGSVFSAYLAATQEYGFMLTVNKMQSAVCEDVLSYDLECDGIVRVETNGQPRGHFVSPVDLVNDAPKRKEFCHSDDGEVNVGFVFETDNVPAHPSCNRACAMELVGECVLTSSESCNNERQYYSSSQCKCVCYDSRATGENCDCPANLVWDSNSLKCVQCLSNSDCSGNTPVCNTNNKCESCSTSAPVWNGTSCVECLDNSHCSGNTPVCNANNECESCPSSAPNWNGTSCEACSGSTPVWNGTSCVECLSDNDCSGNTPVCNGDTNICEACPSFTPNWNGTSCVECLSNNDCSGNTPVCNGDTNICEACPSSTPNWNGTSCVECLSNNDCSGNTPVCNTNNKCESCPTSKPIWNGTSCVECLSNNDCKGTDEVCYQKTHTCEVCPSRIDIKFTRNNIYDCGNNDVNILNGKYGPYVCDYVVYVSGSSSGNGQGRGNGINIIRNASIVYNTSSGHYLACGYNFDGGEYYELPAGNTFSSYVIANSGQKCHKWCCCSENNLTMWMERQ